MNSLYKEVHPPTGIELAVTCHFMNTFEENIVTATANELQVYRINHEVESGPKLECLVSFKLVEQVVSMSAIRLQGFSDHLLLSFNEAKLSLVCYDNETHDLKTSSIHYYEREHLDGIKVQLSRSMPTVRCDPEFRCAAALIYGSGLAVLPFLKYNKSSQTDLSYVVDLEDKLNIRGGILDFQFLQGYYQPTVAILYEENPTWSGRVSMIKDSFAMAVLSLDIDQQRTYSIWSETDLPFDSFQLLPVPEPLKGVLLFASNSLTYFSQGCPPYGVSLNAIARSTTAFRLKQQEGIDITLDCCRACFVESNKMVVSLREGQLYVVTLVNDGANTVRGIRFDKSVTSVIPTCICRLEGEYLFLGSRLGNSLLAKVIAKCYEDNADSDDLSCTRDAEELEIYGEESVDLKTIRYELELCDSIVNIGPCGSTIVGLTGGLSEEFACVTNSSIELVTTSGYGKSGAISVLRRSVRPQIVASFKMSQCTDLWTVSSGEDVGKTALDGGQHSLIILSGFDSSMILRAGNELTELDQGGFVTDKPTVFAGNIDGNHYVVQVTSSEIRLLDGTECIQQISLNAEVVSCSLAGRYLALLTASREVEVVYLDAETSPQLRPCIPSGLKNVLSMSMYHDESGLFYPTTFDEPSDESDVHMMDEEEYLYGTNSDTSPTDQSKSSGKRDLLKSRSYWLATHQENGDLLIYSVPEFELKFRSPYFGSGWNVLTNQIKEELKNDDPMDASKRETEVREMIVVGLGNKNSRPHLMAVINEELVVYEAFQYFTASAEPMLQVRFKKVGHCLDVKDAFQTTGKGRSILRRFENIAGLSGVFLSGTRPCWIFMTSRGVLRQHTMLIDGAIGALSAFNNALCPNGFIYLNSEHDLRLSVLQSNVNYDSHWPVIKIPLKSTPYHIAHHSDKKFYAVSTAVLKPCTGLPKKIEDDEIEIRRVERCESFVYPLVERFSLQFYSSLSWEPLPHCTFEFDEFERVTSMKVIKLKVTEGTACGFKDYLVCGTSYAYGEDIQSRGRIIIMDMIEVVPEPGAPLTKNKTKAVYDKQQKGGVSALAEMNGLLVAAVAQTIHIYQMREGDLRQLSEVNARVYVHSIIVVKSFLLVADVIQSCTLFRYHEDTKTFSFVSRDTQPKQIYSLEFLVAKEKLNFLATDSDKNLLSYSYEPGAKDTLYGHSLVQNSCLKLGSCVNSMFRVGCLKAGTLEIDQSMENCQATYLTTLDGGIGCVIPLPEKMYRKLLMIQTLMSRKMAHNALLNHKAIKYPDSSFRKEILDGVLVSRFHELSQPEKKKLTKESFSSIADVSADLKTIDLFTSHF